jgi:DNA-binding Lrp family transcriptional regulator
MDGVERPAAVLDEADRRIVNALQGGFPVCERPFLDLAERLGLTEDGLIARLERLLRDRVLTRFGPLYNAERMGGANVLAAMAVPEADYDAVCAVVNAQPEIAHNYRREHTLNMWFVGAAETPDRVEAMFRNLEEVTGHTVYRFPKEREYFVALRLTA